RDRRTKDLAGTVPGLRRIIASAMLHSARDTSVRQHYWLASNTRVAPNALSGATTTAPICSENAIPALFSADSKAGQSRATKRTAASRAPPVMFGGSTPQCDWYAAGSSMLISARG